MEIITTPVFEDILIYAGQSACLLAAIYMVKIGQVKLGMLFVISFALQLQVDFVISNIETSSAVQCWRTGGDYYDCMPILYRVSMHAGQAGTFLLGVAIFLSARELRNQNA